MELGGRAVVDGVDLAVRAGEVVGVVGPTGSGKTTLLRTVYRAITPTAGAVLVDGRADVSRRDLARTLAAAVQDPGVTSAALRVVDVVEQGRYSHRRALEPLRPEDRAAVVAAMAAVGITALAGRDAPTLSGGEAQRVSIARALAQQPRVLVLDEPTNHLDLKHQLTVLQTVRALADAGVAVLLTLHDLHLAVRHFDRTAVLGRGPLVDVGPPAAVLTADVLAGVLGVRAVVTDRGLDVLGLSPPVAVDG
ncbi:ABC transporter ATP-binding protein [Actinokineospora soli]